MRHGRCRHCLGHVQNKQKLFARQQNQIKNHEIEEDACELSALENIFGLFPEGMTQQIQGPRAVKRWDVVPQKAERQKRVLPPNSN